MSLLPFQPYSTFAVSGSTGSGKTYWVRKLLNNMTEMFENPKPVEILYCYGVNQELFHQMEQELAGIIKFHSGLPKNDEIEQFAADARHRIIVLDDLIAEVTKSQTMQDLFCQFCHHKHITVLFLTQNLFQQGKYARTIALNTHYIILMKSLRNRSQISYLGRQLFPENSHIISEAYQDSMKQQQFPYLVIDMTPHSKDMYRIRTNIFPGEYPIIYIRI